MSLFFTKSNAESLKAGDAAPAISAVTETGAKLDFGDASTKPMDTPLVYFYPKADAPAVCQAGLFGLRDAYAELTKKGVTVIGVSHDDVAAQKAFLREFK